MGLLQNGYRDYSSGVRIFGATASNNAYPSALLGNTNKIALKRNLTAGEGFASDLVSIPSGYRTQYAWVLAQKNGDVKSAKESEGVATATINLAGGKNAVGTADGVATVTGTAQLVVSGAGTADGVATVTGNILAALAGAGTSAGMATATGTINALAWGVGSSAGVGTAAIVSYATGSLAGSIAPAVTLDASTFSAYLLDEEDIESGLTLRQALRLVAAATAGKVSGEPGTSIVIRNAVADSKSRITATLDGDKNRTAITYDLT